MFTLDQLRCFTAVAEELHFGRAAEVLRMTQPPLSRQIQRLEEHVGVVLLERDNRRVALTEAGRAFLREARSILASAERAPETAREIAAGSSGVLRIGFTAASTYSVLGTLLTRIDEQLPGVQVELEELVTQNQRDGVISGTLDLGIARPPFDPAVFGVRRLFTEDLMLVVPTGHPLADAGEPPTAAQLGAQALILPDSGKAWYFYDLAVRVLPIDHARVVHTVSQIATIVTLVAARRGISFVPASARVLGIKGVTYIPLGPAAEGIVELDAIWNRASTNPALHRALSVIHAASEVL
ncbi:LysR family transcriptional regulator [Microbacterium kribbense]|uniref:LysR family transcriptional regulator n=1 Tax=Microbacterium kribbense TaxID=433645 RepID=A0ABP7G4Q9_9MICO